MNLVDFICECRGSSMILFDNDYTEGAHPKILERLLETNMEQASGYGTDRFSESARNLIKTACEREDIHVHLLSGGTQTNLIIIRAGLRPYQGIISADSGHILHLEAGAIEAIGHKIIPVKNDDGKIKARDVEAVAREYEETAAYYHNVEPGMVYLSNPTEVGTIYSKKELQELRRVCNDYGMKLFIDGARLGYGLVAETNDVSLSDLAELSDVFYFGGTKIGALFGEAVVIRNKEMQYGFRTIIKQKGGLLAKGRALGIQFETLFKDNLYLETSKFAVEQAMRIKEALIEKNILLKYEAYTNQIFPILNHKQLNQLQENYSVLIYEKEDEDHDVIRICTSWGTRAENVDALIKDIKKL